MIISFVSRYNQAGKSDAASFLSRAGSRGRGVKGHFAHVSLMSTVRNFCDDIMGDALKKYEPHPELGITKKQLLDALSVAMTDLHPDLPIWHVKSWVEEYLRGGSHLHVCIDDMRREREFIWAQAMAKKYDTEFHIIEIVPVAAQLETAKIDNWTNGLEPCGYNAWEHMDSSIIFNDGTDKFYDDVIRLVNELQELESV